MDRPEPQPADRPDFLARILEAGLIAAVVLAPVPVGAVTPGGRLGLELGAAALGVLWCVRAGLRGAALPPRAAVAGLAGLLLLGALQIAPLPRAAVSLVSPHGLDLRQDSTPGSEAGAIEQRLLGRDPATLDAAPTLSVEPDRTASALRTGAALVVLLLASCTVARTVGVRRLATALLVSAAAQALYGILVLASGHDMILWWPKRYYLESATGTFVNRNHFAGFLGAALPCGLALVLHHGRAWTRAGSVRDRLVQALGPDGIRPLLFGLLFLLGLSGLLLSLSRAGIAVAILALGATAFAAGRAPWRMRLIVAVLVLAVAAVPLVQIGADRLVDRYARTAESLVASDGRTVVWQDTLGMIRDYPLAGTGFGTFAAVYPLYRSSGVRLFYDHVHNDPLQAVAEGGLVAAVLLGMVLVPLVRRILDAFGGSGSILIVGLAGGLTAVLLHALVDFNFHIPSNAAVSVILAGALLGHPWTPRT